MGIKDYLSLVKFAHTIFALPFAIIGLTLGYFDLIGGEITRLGDNFSWLLFIQVLGCMLFARNTAMAFNRYIDRDIDRKNPRTQDREIPKGIISPKSALFFIILNAVLFVVITYTINNLTFYLSLPALFIILIYSYLKRISYLCHIILGLSLSIAPIGAYIAVTGNFAVLPLILSLLVLLWVSGFDIIYSLGDADFDRTNSLYSIPSRFGIKNALRISLGLHIFIIPLIILIPFIVDLNTWIYSVGGGVFLIMLIYQHLIVTEDDLSRVGAAFFTANGIAAVVYSFFTVLSIVIC